MTEEFIEKTSKTGRSNESTVVAKLKALQKSPDIQTAKKNILKLFLINTLWERYLKNITKNQKALDYRGQSIEKTFNPKKEIPDELLIDKKTYKPSLVTKEVILSEYFAGDKRMNREQAKQLIHNTFDYPFEKHKFVNFIDDLLVDVDFNESFGYISTFSKSI